MTPKRVVLVFAYHYPPENAIGGLRPFRFCKYLAESGFRCHVITAARQPVDKPSPDVTYVPDPFLERQPLHPSWQGERALRKLLLPGCVGTGWAFAAAKAGRQIIQTFSGSEILIFSTFPPLGSQLAGWLLACSERLPWIADLRDPFPEGATGRARIFWQWLQRSCFTQANMIVANTDAAQRALQERSRAQAWKVKLLPNGFDPSEPIGPLPMPPRSFTMLSHIGELYAGRTVAPILESIERLIAAGEPQADDVRVQLVGPAEPSCLPSKDLLEKAERNGWLFFRPEQVPKAEAQQLARTSDRLLLLQPHSAVQIPAKLFEYIQIGRPILAFLQHDSPSERILHGSGIPHRIVYPDMPLSHFDSIIRDFLTLPVQASKASDWFDDSFDVRKQVETLASWFHDLLAKTT